MHKLALSMAISALVVAPHALAGCDRELDPLTTRVQQAPLEASQQAQAIARIEEARQAHSAASPAQCRQIAQQLEQQLAPTLAAADGTAAQDRFDQQGRLDHQPASPAAAPSHAQPRAAAEGAQVAVEAPPSQVSIEQPPAQVRVQQQQPEVAVHTQPPQIAIDVPDAEVQVTQPAPQVQVTQAEPEVQVTQSQPEVFVDQPDPVVTVQQADPVVEVRQGEPQVHVHEAPAQVSVATTEAEVEVGAALQDGGAAGDRTALTAADTAAAPADAPAVQSPAPAQEDIDAQSLRGMNVVNIEGHVLGPVEEVLVDRASDRIHVRVRTDGVAGLQTNELLLDVASLERNAGNLLVREPLDQLDQMAMQEPPHLEPAPDQRVQLAAPADD